MDSAEKPFNDFNFLAMNQIPLSERFKVLPQFLKDVLFELISQVKPEFIWIFGSRVQSKHRPLSDIDIAVQFSKERETSWNRFKLEVEEFERTLLDIDWVNFSEAGQTLKEQIRTTGILIYEHSKK